MRSTSGLSMAIVLSEILKTTILASCRLFSQAQRAALRFPLYLEIFLVRQSPRTLPLAFHSPVLGSVNQSLKPQGAKTPIQRGHSIHHLEIYLAIENCQVKRRHSFSLPLQHRDTDHIIITQRFRNPFLVIPEVGSQSVTLHARLELNGCLALAFRDPGQKALRVPCRSVGEGNTSTFIQKHLAWRWKISHSMPRSFLFRRCPLH